MRKKNKERKKKNDDCTMGMCMQANADAFLFPLSQQPNGQPSPYVDPKYVAGGNQFNPSLVAQQAQDPNHPANPSHPKVCRVFISREAVSYTHL